MAENTIDLQSLEIKPQSPKYSYIGLDENNELVRTDLNAGFANIIERTVYLTSMSWYFDENGQPNEEDVKIIEITEEQRAYNIETYGMSDGDNMPLLTHSGGFFEMSSGHWSPSEGTGEVCFSRVVGDTMLLQEIGVLSIVINQDGDAKGTVRIYDFYSKDEIDTKLENLVVGDVDLSDYYTKSEVDDIVNNIEIPEGGNGGTSDPDSYIIYLPEDYSEDTYNIDDSNDVSTVWHMYNGSDRQTHNAQVIQAINEGKAKSVYLQRIREYFSVYDWENNTFTNTAIFMYTPIQFRQKNEIVDGYTRVFGYYALSEDDNNSIYLVGYNFEDDGSASITIDRSYELEQSGGGGSECECEPIDLSHYVTKSEFDDVVGNINNILTSI